MSEATKVSIKMEDVDKLQVQNFGLQIQVLEEQIQKYKLFIDRNGKEIEALKYNIHEMFEKYTDKIVEANMDPKQCAMDMDNGEITLANNIVPMNQRVG